MRLLYTAKRLSTRRPRLHYRPSLSLCSTSCVIVLSMTAWRYCVATPRYREPPPDKRQEPAVCTAKERSVFGLCRAMTPWPSFILPAGPPLLKRRAAAWASEKCFFQSPRLPLCSWCPPPASLGHRAPKSTALPPALGLTSGFLQPQPERYGRAVFVTERSRRVHEGALRAEMIHCS